MRKDSPKRCRSYIPLLNTSWKPIWPDCRCRSMRPRVTPGTAPNHSTHNHTKTSGLILGEMKVFQRWRGNWTSWLQNILKIAFMLPEWWKGPTACERGFIISDVACALNGIQHRTFPPETSIWEQSSSLLNQLWFIQENWKMKWANFRLFFNSFHISSLSQLSVVMRFIQTVESAMNCV